MIITKSYKELIQLNTFDERLEYLRLDQHVGEITFGSHRYLNQKFYKSNEWIRTKNKVITRDLGRDLGMNDEYYEIPKGVIIIVHHINPVTIEDIINNDPMLIDLNNLITTRDITHRAIHYGYNNSPDMVIKERFKNDTCPWK